MRGGLRSGLRVALAQHRHDELLVEAGLALDRCPPRPQVAGVDAGAQEAAGRGGDLHRLVAVEVGRRSASGRRRTPRAAPAGRRVTDAIAHSSSRLTSTPGSRRARGRRSAPRRAPGRGRVRGGVRRLRGAAMATVATSASRRPPGAWRPGPPSAARRHPARRCRVRLLDLTGVDAVLDDAQRQELLALLAQDHAQQLDVVVEELAVPRRRPLRLDQALALEEADLGDRDVGELLEQQAEDLADRQVGRAGFSHRRARTARDGTSPPAARHRGGARRGRCAPG